MKRDSGSTGLPPGVKRVVARLASGERKAYFYYRGKRIDVEPGTKEFFLALRLADQQEKPLAPPPSVRDLVDAFQHSPEYRAWAPATKRKRDRHLVMIETAFGSLLVADLNRRAVRDAFYSWRDRLAEGAGLFAADAAISTLSRLLAWAYDRGRIEVNHAREIARLAPERGRAGKVWTAEHESIFLHGAPEAWCDAYTVARYTVAREGDQLALDAAMYDGEWLSFQPEKTAAKTGIWVHLPVHLLPPLHAVVERLADRGGRLLRTPHGTPWSKSHFTTECAVLKAKLGLGDADLHWHDLRGTGISEMQDAGCTEAEVKAVTGHAIEGILGSYAARSRELAANAYRKWAALLAARQAETALVIPFSRVKEKGGK